jgi:HD-GYP domain-containing protein (c-di-GMP phosphodiesterase class II)
MPVDESIISSFEGKILHDFYEISDSASSPIDILDTIITKLFSHIGADGGRVLFFDEITGEETVIVSFGNQRVRNPDLRGRELIQWIQRHNTGLPALDNGDGKGRTVFTPLMLSGKIIGVIEAYKSNGRTSFGDTELTMIKRTAALAALPVENIRLEKTRDRSIKEISELMEISAILNSSLDTGSVRERAITVITKLLQCEVASLLLVDELTDELYFEVALGEKGKQVKEIRLKKGEGIAGWVATNNQPVLIDDVKRDPRHSRRFDDRSKFQTRSMICVPMVIKNKVVGVLQAINKLGAGGFSQTDLDLLISLSHEVAIAVDNVRLYNELRETFYQTAEALADAIEKRDPYTGNHTRRVMHYSMAISRFMDLTEIEIENLRLAAILHDIGKIGVEDSVLRKNGELNDEEYEKIIRHPEIGVDILGHIKRLEGVIPGMKSHHERIDGTGYPEKIKDGDIPLIAKIIAVADTFDAMTTNRPYRSALTDREAMEELKRFVGTQFDRAVVNAFIKSYEKGYIAKSVDYR